MTPLVIGYLVGLFTMLAINFVRGCSECEGCISKDRQIELMAEYAESLLPWDDSTTEILAGQAGRGTV